MKRLKPILLSLLLLLTGLAATAVFYPATLLQPLANYYLADSGASLQAIDDIRFGSEDATAGSLVILGPDYEVNIDGLTVVFSMGELLGGVVESVSIQRLTMTWLEGSTELAEGDPAEPLRPSSYLTLLRDLPMDRVRIEEATVPLGSDSMSAQLTLSTDPPTFELETNLASNPTSSLAMTLSSIDDSQLRGSAELSLEGERAVSAELRLELAEASVQGEMSSRVELRALAGLVLFEQLPSALDRAETDSLLVSGSFTITGLANNPGIPELQLTLDSEDTHFEYELDAGITAQLALPIRLGGSADSMDGPFDLTTSPLQLDLHAPIYGPDFAAVLRLTTSDFSCELPLRCVAMVGIDSDSTDIDAGTLRLGGASLAGNFGLQWSGQGMSLDEGEFSLILNELRSDVGNSDLAVALTDVSASYRDTLRASASFSTDNLDPGLHGVELINPVAAGDVELDDQTLVLNLQSTINDRLDNTLHLEHDLSTGSGQLDHQLLPYEFGPLTQLSSLAGAMPVDVDVVDGSAAGQTQLDWQRADDGDWQLSGQVALRLEGISGYYEETVFTGFTSDLQAEVAEPFAIRTDGPQTASLTLVDVGVPVENITWRYEFDSRSQSLHIEDLNTALLGGSLSVPDLEYSLTADSNPMILVLSGLDLASIVGLADYPNLEVAGRISGWLPIVLAADKMTVDEGLVSALNPGGTIRYSPATPAPAGNATLQLVNDALSNYHYETLDSQVFYEEDGDLILDVRLQGTNPDLNAGQAINLNVNIANNIPQMLRSLRASRNINEALEESLQRR